MLPLDEESRPPAQETLLGMLRLVIVARPLITSKRGLWVYPTDCAGLGRTEPLAKPPGWIIFLAEGG
jgi:hypothetical protein